MAKATTTLREALTYQRHHAVWFAANHLLFNNVTAFSFKVVRIVLTKPL